MSQAPKKSTVKPSKIRIRHCNINSIKSKHMQVKKFCEDADICALTETWDNSTIPDNWFADLRSHNVYRRSRADGYGGVALVVKSKAMPSYRREDLEHDELELLVVDIPILALCVAVFYAAPNKVGIAIPLLATHLGSFPQSVIGRLILTGDFNTKDVNWQSKTASTVHGHVLLNCLREMSWKQTVNFPTRADNTLDLIFVPVYFPVLDITAVAPPAATCDHDGQQLDLYVKSDPTPTIKTFKWKFNDLANDLFLDAIANSNLEALLGTSKLEDFAQAIDDTVINAGLKFHQYVEVKISPANCKLPKEVLKLKNARDMAFRRFRSCYDVRQKVQLRTVWKERSKLLEKAIEKVETRKLLQIATSSRHDSKKFWHYVRSSVDKKPLPPICAPDGKLRFDDVERADVFNKAFAEVMLPCTTHCAVHNTAALTGQTVSNWDQLDPLWPPFTDDELLFAMNSLDATKSNGPFQMTTGLLLRAKVVLVSTLTKFFNACSAAGYFPENWKTSYICPIPKSTKDPTSVSSWRPIAILHPLSKLFEKCIANRLKYFLESVDAFGESQFGFRECRSTELAGLVVTQTWTDIISVGREVDSVFLDCSKAFDRVDHLCILRRLEQLGVPIDCRRLLDDYLRNRRQVVTVNGKHSTSLEVTSGVPQGSVLGPCLFIALMSSINNVVSPGTVLNLFADDILVFRPQFSDDDAMLLQEDLDAIAQWGVSNQLAFNPSKSAHLRLSRKKTPGLAVYSLNGITVPSVSSTKYLGLHIDQRLEWASHWSAKCASGRKRIRYLSCLFKYRNSAARIMLYNALVQSLLDYCPAVTWSFLIGSIREIERCARRFLRSIRLGVSSKWSDDERYEKNALEVGWSSQIVRRVKLSLIFAFKLVYNYVPLGHYLFQKYDDPLQSEDAISTRSLARLQRHPCPIQPSGTFFKGQHLPTAPKSFVAIVCKLWNELDLPTDAFESKWKFSSALDSVDWKSVRFLHTLFPSELIF